MKKLALALSAAVLVCGALGCSVELPYVLDPFRLTAADGGSSSSGTIPATTQTVDTPTFSGENSFITSGSSVTISCATEGATIYYTTDGTTPTTSSTQYTSSGVPVGVGMIMIKAIAVKEGCTNSDVASAVYNLLVSINGAAVSTSVDGSTTFGSATSTPVTVASFYMAETETTYSKWCYDTLSSSSSDRVNRGGSWDLSASYCTVACRYGFNPYEMFNVIGFRVVRNAD